MPGVRTNRPVSLDVGGLWLRVRLRDLSLGRLARAEVVPVRLAGSGGDGDQRPVLRDDLTVRQRMSARPEQARAVRAGIARPVFGRLSRVVSPGHPAEAIQLH